MTDEEAALLVRFGITAEPTTIYHYAGFRYERLEDALRFAEIESTRSESAAADGPA